MLLAHPLTPDTLEVIAPLYEQFCTEATEQYHWDYPPVPFEEFKQAFAHGLIKGFWVQDSSDHTTLAFMLYRLEDHRAIEINLIYTVEEAPIKSVLEVMMKAFQKSIATEPGWDTVSYAMLGKQAELVRSITWYGFKPVGQAIVKFDLMDSISIQIMHQQAPEAMLPEGYQIVPWDQQYGGDTAQSIFESFETASDARWDPRFRSLTGARRVLALVTSGGMGNHLHTCSRLLLKDGVAVGFCFLVQSNALSANIPLIGVRPSEKGKNFGKQLLYEALQATVSSMLEGKVFVMSVTATLDTDNVFAIKMYRRLGFREEYNYPHVYLVNPKAQSTFVLPGFTALKSSSTPTSATIASSTVKDS